jgi:transcription elongation factor Elf1
MAYINVASQSAEGMRELLKSAREVLRKKVKCPLCGKKSVVLVESREEFDVFSCNKCGLYFYIP